MEEFDENMLATCNYYDAEDRKLFSFRQNR